MRSTTKYTRIPVCCRWMLCSFLILGFTACQSGKSQQKSDKINEAAILEMTPEEFAAYQKEQERLQARRRADSLATRQKKNKSFERYSVEKRKRLGDPGRPALLNESANSVFPWKSSEKRQSELILERNQSSRTE